MMEVETTNGKTFYVDDDDYDLVAGYTWYWTGRDMTYLQAWVDGRAVYLHRMLMSPPDGKIVDHIDMDTRNNCRSNLRLVDYTQNTYNRGKPRGSYTSKYKGVSWYPKLEKWTAKAYLNQKQKHLGYFASEHDAARAYNAFVSEHFREHARLNTITEDLVDDSETQP